MRIALLARLLAAYVGLLALACGVVCQRTRLHPTVRGELIASVWREGKLVARAVLADPTARDARVEEARAASGATLVLEEVVAQGPILRAPEILLGLSLVAGRDGVRATLGDRTAYVTADDLLARQIYDRGEQIQTLTLTLGLDVPKLVYLLSRRLGVTPQVVAAQARLERIRTERRGVPERPRIDARSLSREQVRGAVLAAAGFLARGLSQDGHYRYVVDATTNETLPGYDWPRHAGATFFLAQAAALSGDEAIATASRKAAILMRAEALGSCGDLVCIADGSNASLGASALALLAYVEIVQHGIDPSYRTLVVDLARFVRTQQRPDGEFMHYYDRSASRPIDHQGLYYSSEATLALARAHRITLDPADLEAARRGLANLVGPAWSFFGDRYYFGEEHWTCQAMAELWPLAPDRKALDFCLRWQAFGRVIQQREGDSPFDADGAVAVGPVLTPRLTPVASRCEAAVATLDIARRAGVAADEIAALDLQIRRALALLARQQLLPGPTYLFKSPGSVFGAMPGSEVDWQLRIDYAQHAGSAMVRWLEVTAPARRD